MSLSFKKILTLFVLLVAAISLSACSGEEVVGSQGPVGEQGEAGLSAFDLYLAEFPRYLDTEDEWTHNLASNALVIEITLEFLDGTTETFQRFKGDVFGSSPYVLDWNLDDDFEDLVDEEVVLEAETIFIPAGNIVQTAEGNGVDIYVKAVTTAGLREY